MTDTIERPVDVNQAFHDTRREQIEYNSPERVAQRNAELQATYDKRIAEGKLRNLGNGRYKVTEPGSWDNGEVLYLRTEVVNGAEQRIIVPETGLDTSTGAAALYAHRQMPIWHELGYQPEQAERDIYTIMDKARLRYLVGKSPVLFRNLKTGEIETLPGHFVTARDDVDSNSGFGVVGRIWEGFQNLEGFELLMEVVDEYDLAWDSAGALGSGAKTFVCVRLPESVFIDADGINDEIILFLHALNDHSGQGKLDLITSPWRTICGNTERMAIRDAVTRFGVRHTRNMRDNLEQIRRGLKLSFSYAERWKTEEELLAHTAMTIDTFHKTAKKVFGEPKEGAKKAAVTRHENRMATLTELWTANTAQLGKTAYAGERAFTEFLDWKSALRPSGNLKGKFAAARATAVVEGAKDKVKDRVHRRMMALAQR